MNGKFWAGPKIVGAVMCLSLFYWAYLGLSTRMAISCDAIGYEALGKLIQQHGFIPAYFEKEPNREPIYPLLVASSMHLAPITGAHYTKIMAAYGILILFMTQILTYMVLRRLKIRPSICALALAYMGISPALNNSAFSLYSEIAATPFILGIVLASHQLWQAIGQNNTKAATGWGGVLGLLLTCATLIKAVFELIAPVYLLILIGATCCADRKHHKQLPCLAGLLAALALFYIPITGYKYLNQKYNGQFVITNRGSWALYGNTARRQELLTLKRFLAALAYAPGEGLCTGIFTAPECDFWSYRQSDDFGYRKLSELTKQYYGENQEVNRQLIRLSAQQALKNPAQYVLLTAVEGLKMFFWESTQIGFVSYPLWLTKIYENKWIKNCLRLGVALLTLTALIFVWGQCMRPRVLRQEGSGGVLLAVGLLIFLFIFFYSFFFILTRYALPIAPLYVISIATAANFILRGFRFS